MSSRRRRADDFTDSLRNFRETLNREHSQTASQIYSEDSLDIDSTTNKQCRSDKHSCSNNNEYCKGSIILASNLTNEHYVSSSDTYHTAEESCGTAYNALSDVPSDVPSEASYISDQTSYMQVKLDLNKCINLFHNKHLDKEHETCEECSNVSTTSSKMKEAGPCYLNTAFTDTPNKASNDEKIETIVPPIDTLSLSESSVSLSKEDCPQTMAEEQKCDSISSGNTSEDIDFHELKTLLHSLENKQKSPPPKEAPIQEHMLRRLSTMFHVSPYSFTDRLLTIIEESVITNDSDMRDFPDVSLRRLTTELKKMCKFIDNETMPEWPTSPGISTSIHARERDGQSRCDLSHRSFGTFPSPSKDPHTTTPVASSSRRYSSISPRKIFRRTPKTISAALHNTPSSMYETTNVHDNTSTFEYLEDFCKKLFPDERKPSPKKMNHLQSPLQNMSTILHTCNAQMQSLEDSYSEPTHEPVQNCVTSTSDTVSQYDTVPEIQSVRQELTPSKCRKILSKSASPKQHVRRSSIRCDMREPDDLEKTLMYEIAKKRQRCLDIVKVIMEIDSGNLEESGTQETCPINNVSQARLSTDKDKDSQLMETLISCQKYQDYLEEYKPLLNLLQRSESLTSRFAQSKKDVYTKGANRATVATLAAPKSSTTRGKNSRSPSPKTLAVPKPKLFITPGKTSVRRTARREQHTYFRNLKDSPNKQGNLKKDSNKATNISPCVQSIYRRMGMNYDSVISPVGMYIKGTNPHLIKNLRPKTDEMLLTPRKEQVAPFSNAKPEMKFRLSPKELPKTPTAAGDENVPDNFLHPKVHYKLPSHVRTIKETENRKGSRMNALLRSTKDKVVIRHEGRTKTVQTDCLEQPEIHYDSAEESVHIEQTARKTHFSRVQKGH